MGTCGLRLEACDSYRLSSMVIFGRLGFNAHSREERCVRVFILEDDPERVKTFRDRYRREEITHAATASEAIAILLEQPPFDIVQLDHDLDGQQMIASGPGTGLEVANAIAEMAGREPHGRIIVHSFNP